MACSNPVTHKIRDKDGYWHTVTHGCGQCENCLRKRQRDWVFRCSWEARKHPYNWVLTLTYADEFLPFTKQGNATLRKSDFQKFMKRLRFNYPDMKIRYLVRGEYGGMFGRPHYHCILFGFKAFSKEQVNFMVSDEWHFGNVYVDTFSDASVAYVTNYVLKADDMSVYEDEEIVRPYINVSQRPAIGANFLDSSTAKRAFMQNDYVLLNEDGTRIGIPRYLAEKLDLKDDIFHVERKHVRKRNLELKTKDKTHYSKNYEVMREVNRADSIEKKKHRDYLRNKAKKH